MSTVDMTFLLPIIIVDQSSTSSKQQEEAHPRNRLYLPKCHHQDIIIKSFNRTSVQNFR